MARGGEKGKIQRKCEVIREGGRSEKRGGTAEKIENERIREK